MKKINTYMDYVKLVIVLLLFMIGSEPTKRTLIFLLIGLFMACMAAVYLMHKKQIYERKYKKYLADIEYAVRSTISKSEHNKAA